MTDDLSPPSGSAAALPAVSVVLPAYNREGSIRLAIDSVLRQSFADFELIVVDDASTDGTRAAAEAVADPRVRVIAHPANRGASAARNTGVAAARAPFVAFQDSDDEWLPLKLEKQMARLLAPRPAGAADYVAAYCGMMILGEPHGPLGTPEGRMRPRYFPDPSETAVEGDLLVPLLRMSLVSTQTLVARADRLREVGGFDPDLKALIDWDCVLRLAPLGPIAFVDEPLALQRFSQNSITRDHARKLAAQKRVAQKHAALFAAHPKLSARHHYVMAGGHRRAGDLPSARAAVAEARRLDPGNPRYAAMALALALRRLVPRG